MTSQVSIKNDREIIKNIIDGKYDTDDENEKPYKMPFGIFKDKTLKEIIKITELKDNKVMNRGRNYLSWLCKQEFFKDKDKVLEFLKYHKK